MQLKKVIHEEQKAAFNILLAAVLIQRTSFWNSFQKSYKNCIMRDSLGKAIAFMDMGTNSMRLMIVRIDSNHTYTILSRQKEMIRLGEGEFEHGYILEESMDRAAAVCRNFSEMASSFKASELICVATSAVRDANNRTEFLSRIKKEAELDIHVVSGTEEARLIYLGVSRGTSVTERSLFIDIGGGSTELIVGDAKNYEYLDSMKVGAIRLGTHLVYDPSTPISTTSYLMLQDYVRNKSIRSFQWIRGLELKNAYGSSGTVQNLAEICCQTLYRGDPEKRKTLTLPDLKQVVSRLCSLPLAERRLVPGINPSRADILIAGAAILDTVLTDLNIQEIQVSNRELRDGLLVDYLSRVDRHAVEEESSVRQTSVLQLGRRSDFDEDHARMVARLGLELFDSARGIGIHNQSRWERELFFYAALLHDVGSFLSYTNHHANSAWFIRNADLLGFSQEELSIIAATAYFHRKELPGDRFPDFIAMEETGRETVKGQFIFLRIAESLDRSHAGLVESARFLNGKKGGIVLEVFSSKDCQLELWGIEKHCEAFEKFYGKPLTIAHVPKGKQ
jgi:exopolyphosphatase / guanosine-5'-triphosphate,3'-diphosphate pyrophosphatase